MGFDKRQIQTAVWGNAKSDEPLICPTDPDDLDAFRAQHRTDTFWCGVLLGGCGGQLLTRRCDTRVCHFSHFPDPDGLLPECVRRARGVSSADHLYVKTATQSWLHEQGHAPHYRFIDRSDVPIGSVVEIQLDGHMLRIHMNTAMPPGWNDDNARELILGPGVSVDRPRLLRMRYVNRVKFESDGNSRKMRFGTQTPHEGTTWFDASECEIVDGVLKTPAVARIWSTEGRTPAPDPEPKGGSDVAAAPDAPVGPPIPNSDVPRAPVQIGALVRRINTAVQAQEIAVVRRLCGEADEEVGRCEDFALEHLNRSVGSARRWLGGQERLRRTLFSRLEEATQAQNARAAEALRPQVKQVLALGDPPTATESEILTAVDRLVSTPQRHPARSTSKRGQRSRETRRGRRASAERARGILQRLGGTTEPVAVSSQLIVDLATAAETAGDWLSSRERSDVDRWTQKQPGKVPAEAAPAGERDTHSAVPAVRSPVRPAQPRLGPDALASAAAAVRGALKKSAREETTTTWARLRHQLGSALPRMAISDRIQVLILVDQATPPTQALLSSLVAAGDPEMTPHYRSVTGALGLEAPSDDDDLRDVLDADVQQVYDDWRYQ
ncbi:hypothetical protein [Streptomyces niveus]|uniref:hypothetical protein n=1 Tax=Streptomyces niveus TaxID=193462 RepID=UPI00341BE4A1